MSATLNYSITHDFSGGLQPSLLQKQVLASACEAVLSHITTNSDACSLVFETEPSPADVDVVNAVVAAHVVLVSASRNFLVAEYNNRGDIDKETWYGTDNGGGSYSHPVEETVYTYGGPNNKTLMSKTITQLLPDGSSLSPPEVWNYVTDGDKRIMKKVGA